MFASYIIFALHLQVNQVSAQTFAEILDYLYSGNVALHPENFENMKAAARLFQLPWLLDFCDVSLGSFIYCLIKINIWIASFQYRLLSRYMKTWLRQQYLFLMFNLTFHRQLMTRVPCWRRLWQSKKLTQLQLFP